jgi:hypothetical protein
MSGRSRWLVAVLLAAAACGGGNGGRDDAGEVPGEADVGEEAEVDAEADALGEGEAEAEAEADAPPGYDPIVPVIGASSTEALDCAGAYELPEEFTGPDGLGHHGWDVDDLRFSGAWSVSTRFATNWISTTGSSPSIRTRPWYVPEAGYCYQRGIAADVADAAGGAPLLAPVLRDVTPFNHADGYYGNLWQDLYVPPDYPLDEPHALVRAIRGLYELPNALPEAPGPPPWDDAIRDGIVEATAEWPAGMQRAVARLVLSVGEAYLLKQQAIAAADPEVLRDIHRQFLSENYASSSMPSVNPLGGSVIDDVIRQAPRVDLTKFYAAGFSVAAAAEECRRVLADVEPFASPGLNLRTPHGRLLVSTGGEDTEYAAEDLEDAALVVDLGGDDTYHGRYAATHEFWMSAAVVVDAAGDDLYTPETADIEAPGTTVREAFDRMKGFTQGCGLFGVGVLIDGGGRDAYTATVYAQGSSAFGVGLLLDEGSANETYKLGMGGQGQGYFGIGALIDGGGDDHYGVYTIGQGAGRAWGHGLLLDLGGNDTYIGYYAEGPGYPGPGYNDYLLGASPYVDADGHEHHMSECQGVGWGYRGDWFTPVANWAGGFGALVDLGDGDDEHYADCMAMGQGFVYGFGFLWDGGGDDVYRTFWWGPSASAHMGVNLLVDDDGNDDIHVEALSGGYGYDFSVGWTIDNGGNDTYGGQFNYGRAYLNAFTFMVNDGGDDVYNADLAQADPRFGYVNDGASGTKLLGLFLDLGGGDDTYNTTVEGIGNDAEWYLDPVGDGTNPENHKGIGIDR